MNLSLIQSNYITKSMKQNCVFSTKSESFCGFQIVLMFTTCFSVTRRAREMMKWSIEKKMRFTISLYVYTSVTMRERDYFLHCIEYARRFTHYFIATETYCLLVKIGLSNAFNALKTTILMQNTNFISCQMVIRQFELVVSIFEVI